MISNGQTSVFHRLLITKILCCKEIISVCYIDMLDP
jgi:hypothetical protein